MPQRNVHLVKSVWTWANDICLGIETAYGPASKIDSKTGTKHQDGSVYQAVDYWNIRRVLCFLAPGQTDVFYDIGCGKGRVVCCVARLSLRRVVGIEFDPTLCDLARRNANLLRGRKTPVEIRCEDGAVAQICDGTIYFMFNPFGEKTMIELLKNIKCSLSVNPRAITLVYSNPVLRALLDSCEWLHRIHELKNLTGGKIIIWRSCSQSC